MLDSVRGRLALWHTAVLAVMLVAFASATDLWMARAVGRREDRFLEETTNAFRANVAAELAEVPLDTAIEQSLAEFRLRNVSFVLVDQSGKTLAQSSSRDEDDAAPTRRHRARRGVPDAGDVARALA